MPMNLDLPNFAEQIKAFIDDDRKLPPVDQWHPERSGEIDIRIDREGQWFFQGEPMSREATVRLFSTILRKDGEEYWLVTPAEKMKIQVEDVPFIVRLMDAEGEDEQQQIYFSTGVGDHFPVNASHTLAMQKDTEGELIPYVEVRAGLKARLSRPVYYQLAELATENPEAGQLGVWSGGTFFALSE